MCKRRVDEPMVDDKHRVDKLMIDDKQRVVTNVVKITNLGYICNRYVGKITNIGFITNVGHKTNVVNITNVGLQTYGI